MQLLVVRHGKAKSRDAFAATGLPDSERPLKKRGQKEFREAMPGLRRRVPSIALLASSSLTRAMQTAQIISESYNGLPIVQRHELAPGATPALLAWLAAQNASPLVIVGHEPSLTDLLGVLLSESSQQDSALKKGAMCLLNFERQIAPGQGTLLWMMTSRELSRQG